MGMTTRAAVCRGLGQWWEIADLELELQGLQAGRWPRDVDEAHDLLVRLGVSALVLILLIPLLMITGVLTDRLQRRNEAVADITSSWGKDGLPNGGRSSFP